MSDDQSPLRREIKQRRPFVSPAQEATVGLWRTADGVGRQVSRVIEAFGLTQQQYNVLRILRGAHPGPLPTLEIRERMIEEQPGITRLLDRLEAKGLVRRERCTEDRRMVHCWISDEGLELLERMDEPVDRADQEVMRPLSEAEQRQLIALLDRIRAALE